MTAALRRRLGLPVAEPEPAEDPHLDDRAHRFHTYGITR